MGEQEFKQKKAVWTWDALYRLISVAVYVVAASKESAASIWGERYVY
jgi:hypothetical protein